MENNLLNNVKIGCIGCGMMGGALITAISKTIGGEKILLSDAFPEKAESLGKEISAKPSTNEEIAKTCSHIILAVKPVFLPGLLDEISSIILARNDKPALISIVAGLSIEKIRKMSGFQGDIVRLMPNLPATVGEGMIALCSDTKNDNTDFVKNILAKAGKVEEVPESLMDCVTAVSGSGPAYAFMFIEALADAAVNFGMPRKQAYIYAAQTLKGAASLVLETGKHPAELKDGVCSPAGTTIEGVKVLEEKGFRSAIISGTEAAYKKSIELGKK